jgi:hypothetical protein
MTLPMVGSEYFCPMCVDDGAARKVADARTIQSGIRPEFRTA